MKKLLSAFKVKTPPNQFFDLVLSLIDKVDLPNIKRVSDHTYSAGDATISIKYFEPECFEEMQISFGYAIGKGVTVVLRNYIEHLIVINHEFLGVYQTIEFPIPTDSFTLKGYRERFDEVAVDVINHVKGLPNA